MTETRIFGCDNDVGAQRETHSCAIGDTIDSGYQRLVETVSSAPAAMHLVNHLISRPRAFCDLGPKPDKIAPA